MTIDIGAPAPDFTLKNQHGEEVTLSSFRGERNVVLVFFPFAFSGTCTGELCEIRDNIGDFASQDADVLAISCDAMFSNRAYAERDGFEFSILSDFWPHGEVARTYGVFNETIGAATRGTFLVDREGLVRWMVRNELGEARDLSAYRTALADLS